MRGLCCLSPLSGGALAFSDDPIAHDIALARLMGSDPSLIPVIREASTYTGVYGWWHGSADIDVCRSNLSRFECPLGRLESMRDFAVVPTQGWAGHFARCTAKKDESKAF